MFEHRVAHCDKNEDCYYYRCRQETAILLAKNWINVVVCSRARKEIDSLAEEINMMDNQYCQYHHHALQHKEILMKKNQKPWRLNVT